MAKVAKNIVFSYGGKEYTLEFNRKTVESMERRGFKLSDMDDKPLTTLPKLFAGAFMMHHRGVANNQQLCDEMLKKFKNREDLYSKLMEMYMDPVQTTLFDDPEDDEGNVDWDPNW